MRFFFFFFFPFSFFSRRENWEGSGEGKCGPFFFFWGQEWLSSLFSPSFFFLTWRPRSVNTIMFLRIPPSFLVGCRLPPPSFFFSQGHDLLGRGRKMRCSFGGFLFFSIECASFFFLFPSPTGKGDGAAVSLFPQSNLFPLFFFCGNTRIKKGITAGRLSSPLSLPLGHGSPPFFFFFFSRLQPG